MTTANTNDTVVKSAETAFAIVETLREREGARITELAAELGMAKSTVHRHLNTLYRCGYITREGHEYHVGLRFLELSEHARDRRREYVLARDKVEELARETAERAQFIVEEHGQGVYVHLETGAHAVHTDSGVGKRIPLHATSAGKAILARWSDEAVERLLDEHGLEQLTDQTLTEREDLFAQLAEIRERGYSVNNQENTRGIRAVGVPVSGPDGRVIGALSVSGPTHRMKGDRLDHELPDLLLGTANELELNIMYE
ncbi:IclR family transcriptional regulator [Halomarina halobia]|uniref:IclR family transcriptional regulator n=1 Tax=Halomarina halobia TaxID=3033386 RepID=A0ABD6ADT8_9EURY|nr:IclR family transcriptional regulator [Halomarina sp. PSR21]